MIYRREYRLKGEDVYVAGLLHDIGIIVVDQFMHDTFIEILKTARRQKKNLVDVEDQIIGYNHSDIGMAIAEDWNFPDDIIQAIANHHRPDDVTEEFVRMKSTVYIADCIVQEKYIGYCDAPLLDRELYESNLDKLHVKEMAVDIIVNDVEAEFEKMANAGFFTN